MNQIAVVNNSITVLGSKGFIRKSGAGNMIAVEHNVELSYKKDEFYMMEQKFGTGADQTVKRSYMITAAGYDKINQYAGLKDVQLDIIKLDGKEFRNPHIIFDDKGNKQSVFQLSAVTGLGPDGKMYTSSSLIIYNANDSFMTDLLYKIQYNSKFGEMAPRRVYDTKVRENPYLEFYDVDDRVGVIVDLKNTEFCKMYNKFLEERKTAERKVKTIAKRNAMRKHPAISAYKLDPINKGTKEKPEWVAIVPVVQWVGVDESLFEEEMNAFSESEQLIAEKYHESDKDLDPDDQVIDDDVVEIGFNDDEHAEDDERKSLIAYILDAPVDESKKVGVDGMTINELGALKMEIDQLVYRMEESQ